MTTTTITRGRCDCCSQDSCTEIFGRALCLGCVDEWVESAAAGRLLESPFGEHTRYFLDWFTTRRAEKLNGAAGE